MKLQSLVITRGRDGMVAFTHRQKPADIPIFGSDQVADVTGAGDTVIATFTAALAAGASAEDAAHLANYAGGIVVMKRGTATVSQQELLQALDQAPPSDTSRTELWHGLKALPWPWLPTGCSEVGASMRKAAGLGTSPGGCKWQRLAAITQVKGRWDMQTFSNETRNLRERLAPGQAIANKILTRAELQKQVAKWRQAGDSITLANGGLRSAARRPRALSARRQTTGRTIGRGRQFGRFRARAER